MQSVARPLRLLMLTDTAILGPGGSERFLRNLLTNLPGDRYSIDVLQLAAPPNDEQRVAQIDSRSVRLMYRPVGAIYAAHGIAAFRSVRRMVLGGHYDILQSQHEKSDLINAFLPRIAGVRRISNRRDMGFQKSGRVRAVLRRANHHFDRIVAPSGLILQALIAEENADSARCLAIPNGVDTRRFHPVDASDRALLRSALGFGAGECVIGCVASFTPVKEHAALLAAFALVHDRHPYARLVLVGDGPLRADLEQQSKALGVAPSVRFLGARGDVERILPAFDLFVLASRTEGMSNAILEAQACAVAVVATDVDSNSELVRSQASGVLVPASNAAALAGALSDLVDKPDRRFALGAAALRSVVRDYSLAAMTAAYERLYQELAHA